MINQFANQGTQNVIFSNIKFWVIQISSPRSFTTSIPVRKYRRPGFEICFNAKVQRPAVCNAMETMLVHEKVADAFLPATLERFRDAGVEIRGCLKTLALMPDAKPAEPEDWPAEFLDLILAVKVVARLVTSRLVTSSCVSAKPSLSRFRPQRLHLHQRRPPHS